MSISFKDPLVVVSVDSRLWELYSPFHYKGITIPRGFRTDFASVPRLFWNILPPWGRYGKAAVVHDYLYKNLGDIIEEVAGVIAPRTYTRKECDQLFLQGMQELGVRWTRRWVMYLGVRIGGWVAWRNHERNKRNEAKV